MNDLEKALTVSCPGCKRPAGSACVDLETLREVTGVHQVRIYRAYVVSEAIAENEAYELRAALVAIRDLHREGGRLTGEGYPEGGFAWCKTCGSGEPHEYPTHWPCATLRAIPEELL